MTGEIAFSIAFFTVCIIILVPCVSYLVREYRSGAKVRRLIKDARVAQAQAIADEAMERAREQRKA
jgi:hypothetical protein